MMRALYTGVSGLSNHQTRMDVLSNNIANVNTVGFKASRTVFSDALSQTIQGATSPQGNVGGINAKQVGLGVRTAAIDILFNKTSFQTTNVNTDLAINNNGFFIVNNGAQSFYTRAGNFNFDQEGNFVNVDGLKVMGWMADENGYINTATQIQAIKIPVTATMKPKITTLLNYNGNLNASAKLGDATSISKDVYDSQGFAHRVTTIYTKIGDNQWLATSDVSSTELGTIISGNTKLIEFDAYGKFISATDVTSSTTANKEILLTEFSSKLDLPYNATVGDRMPQITVPYTDSSGNTQFITIDAVCSNSKPTSFEINTDFSFNLHSNCGVAGDNFSKTFLVKDTDGNTHTASIKAKLAGPFTPGKYDSPWDITFEFNGVTHTETVTLDPSKTTGYGDEFINFPGFTTTLANGDFVTVNPATMKAMFSPVHTNNLANSDLKLDQTMDEVKWDVTFNLNGTTQTGTYSPSSSTFVWNSMTSGLANGDVVTFQPDAKVTIEHGVIAGGIFVEPKKNYSSTISNAFQAPGIVLNANGKIGDVKEDAVVFTDVNGKMHALGVKATCTASPNGTNPATWKVEFFENGKVVGSQSYSATGKLPPIKLSDGSMVTFFGANTDVTIGANPTNINATKLVNLGTNIPLSFQPAGGTASPLSIVTSHLDLTQYAGGFNLGSPVQDGYPTGDLEEKVIDASGTIVGKYSNGQLLNLGQIAMAIFNNQQGLERAGSTLFTKSNNSGDPIIGTAGNGGRGTMQAGALEMANVDLAEEFTNMIVTQRGYQSNSRVITTSDEMLQELLNLKR